MKKDGVGGGNTITGLKFEDKANFQNLLFKMIKIFRQLEFEKKF